MVAEGDITATMYCPFCRRWNIIKDQVVSQGQYQFPYKEEVQYYDCPTCENNILQFEGECFFKVSCQTCSAISQYPSREVAQAKKTGYNISRYLRQGRTKKKLVPKKGTSDKG